MNIVVCFLKVTQKRVKVVTISKKCVIKTLIKGFIFVV